MNAQTADDRDRVGPYRLVKAIGAGGSARIDLARIDRAYNFQRHVVIKRPLEHLRTDPKAAASLRREARIGARLRHPNLVGVLDTGVHDNYDYLVLEYVHGGSLRTLMQTDAPSRVHAPPAAVALALVGDAARGLHAAHELADDTGGPLGLVHRDVSPGNILLGLDGAVKLADFGIAKETRIQTLSGSMHGTVTYMAPEQCRGHAFDRRADVFSLGVILYELLTGTRLFWADNDVASLHKVLSGNVTRPRKHRPQLAPALEDIIMTAIAHEQDRRFATARDLADALEIHAHEIGEPICARYIARWVHDLLGPRDNPWIGAQTMIDLAPIREEPLVELIEAVPADEPPALTFGPTAPHLPDEVDTKPRADPPARTRHRKVLAGVIALGIVAGIGATAFVMTRDARSTGQPEIESTVSPPPTPSAQTPTSSQPLTGDEATNGSEAANSGDAPNSDDAPNSGDRAAQSDDTPTGEPSKTRTPTRRRRPATESSASPTIVEKQATTDKQTTTNNQPTTDKQPASDTSATTNKQASTDKTATDKAPVADKQPAPAGSGSSRPAKVEWKPTMLLPTDSKK